MSRAPLRALWAALVCAEVTRAVGRYAPVQLLGVIDDEQCWRRLALGVLLRLF